MLSVLQQHSKYSIFGQMDHEVAEMNENERMSDRAIDLTQKQIDSILALLGSPTIEEACRKADVSKTSVYEWLKTPEYAGELKRQRGRIMEQCTTFLMSQAAAATEGLVDLLKAENPGLKRLVCKDIIDLSLRAVEIEELREKLEEIERRIDGNGSR